MTEGGKFARLAEIRSARAEIGDWEDRRIENEDDPRPMAGNDFDQAALNLSWVIGPLFVPGVLEGIIEDLERAECGFWACRGPEVEPGDMMTCGRCSALYRLRAALS